MSWDERPARPLTLADRVRYGRTVPTGARVPGAGFASRTEAITWAATVVADPRAVFLDTETTGLGPDAEVVDVAVIDVLGRVLLDTLVRPHGHIPPDASRIHGIYARHVADAPSWGEVQPRLCEALAGRRVVVYNAPYDWGVVTGCDGRW
ncbi:MAG: 3'-5' exonuclease, partial [Chloroflexota bacterium]|nr:3'-5' exonuclease [Chloroflexota bacterium]